jgi:hypothetical protein
MQQSDGDSSSDQASTSSSDDGTAQLDAAARQLGTSAGKEAAKAIVGVELLIIALILLNASSGVLGGLFICAIVYNVGKLFRGGRKPSIG